jgi:hypothetical protein
MERGSTDGWSIKGKYGQEVRIPKIIVLGITSSDLTIKTTGVRV